MTLALGDGPFDLPDPTVGLVDLTNYVATLTVAFSGTGAGTPVSAKTSATMRVSPEGRELTIDRGADGPTTYRAEIAGASYTKAGDGPCTAGPIVEGESLADLYEPAAQLSPLVGADEAGSETVDDVPARHHTFDQRALVMPNLASASGDLWVAETGGYVVRYRLSIEAGPEYFGEETVGTRTLDYELSVANEPLAIELPADCGPQVPSLPDATDVVRGPGVLSFQSTMGLAKAARSYATQLKALGWKPRMRPNVTKSTALLALRKGRSNLTVIMRRGPESTAVEVVVTRQVR